jgi:hypothetical protein
VVDKTWDVLSAIRPFDFCSPARFSPAAAWGRIGGHSVPNSKNAAFNDRITYTSGCTS